MMDIVITWIGVMVSWVYIYMSELIKLYTLSMFSFLVYQLYLSKDVLKKRKKNQGTDSGLCKINRL